MKHAWISKKARLAFILALAAGLALAVYCLPERPVYAQAGRAPLAQGTAYPGYVTPTQSSGNGYPAAPTETPAAARTNTPTRTASGPAESTPTQEDTPFFEIPTDALPSEEASPQPPNLFLTEEAEMGGAPVTPGPSETPGPTITPVFTETPERPTLTPTPEAKSSGLKLDWGLFWIGFAVPVLAGCGWVLYLLDHNPNLFRRKK